MPVAASPRSTRPHVADLDAIVVGAGPNGLAAAVVLARAGLRVRLFERSTTIGGGSSTAELTLPGFLHDVCSAVHPMALASPFFREFGLAARVRLLTPEISYAHPLDGGGAGIAYRDLARTADELGVDGRAWRALLGWLVRHDDAVSEVSGSSLVRVPRHPFALAGLGVRAFEQGGAFWNGRFRSDVAPALLTGVIAHANRALPDLAAASAGLVLATHAHAGGWPIPVGGSQAIADALAADFVAHGGSIETGVEITSLADLPPAQAVLLDVTPQALASLAGDRLGARYGRRFRYGSAVAKVDYALDGPVPWTNPALAQAVSLHLGGTRAEIASSERDVAAGRIPAYPYVVLSQPSVLDETRAPAGRHVVWAYTHVPAGSTIDRSDAITGQIERFAPGFRDRILASASSTAVQLEAHNPNYVGGDIASGDVSFGQLLARPKILDPWSTPIDGVYLCSASTAPGPGVHGMGGYHAARRALAREFGVRQLPELS
jgi:phytoene dehydrogenase-like protein